MGRAPDSPEVRLVRFENVGLWASDNYHTGASDAWTAIEHMTAAGVPERAQRKLLGRNAAQAYRIEQKMFAMQSQEIKRPAWFPKEHELRGWWEREKYPRRHGVAAAPHG